MAVYTLFDPLKRDTTGDSIAYAIGHRTRWVFNLNLASVPAGGSVEVAVEASPTGDDDQFVQVYTFGSKSAAGTFEASSFVATPDFTIEPYYNYLRGTIVAISGTSLVFHLVASGLFFDILVSDDKELLSKPLQSYTEAERLIRQAERDVVDLLVSNRATGELWAWINEDGFDDAIKAEVVEQAEWLFQREMLQRAARKDKSAQVTLRDMALNNPQLGKRLADFRPVGTRVWRGR